MEVADGWVGVEISNGEVQYRFRCATVDTFAPGDGVTVAVRPEHIRLFSDSPDSSVDNCVDGQVVAANFLGNYIDCRVQWGAVEWKIQADRYQGLKLGQRVWLTVPPQHCLCLRD